MAPLTGWRKATAYLFSTVLLGAIGSGVWEMVGRAATQWISRLVLNGITLGSNTMKDAVYREAAKGQHEAASLYLLFLALTVVSGAWATSLGYLLGERRGKAVAKETIQVIDRTEDHTEREKLLKKRIAVLERELAKLMVRTKWSLATLLMLILGGVLTNFLEFSEANQAYTFYAQTLSICSPYMSESAKQSISSRYAGMEGRADYLSIIDGLRKVADANGRKLPSFSPW